MIKRLIFTLAMLCTMAVIPSKGQAIIAGQPCGAPGVSAIATNGQAVLCQGSPLVWTATGGSSSGGGFSRNVIDMAATKYNGFWDVQFCNTQTATVTESTGSNQISCSTANFTSADLGKHFWMTNGCCAVTNNYLGQLVLGSPTTIPIIGQIVNSTTVKTCTDITCATPVNVAAPGCTGTLHTTVGGCNIAWGHNDDTAVAAAETDWGTSANGKCSILQWPGSAFFIAQAHWNTLGNGCGALEPTVDYTSTVRGWGPGVSLAVVEPTMMNNLSGCTFGPTSDGCWLTNIEIIVEDLGFYGLGYAQTTSSVVHKLIAPGFGSQFYNVSLSGFAGGDSGASGTGFNRMVGFQFGVGTRATFLSCDGFGSQCFLDNQPTAAGGAPSANSVCLWCFAGDTKGQALYINPPGSVTYDHSFIDFGGDWGPTAGTILMEIVNGSSTAQIRFKSYGGHGFKLNSSTPLTADGGSALESFAGPGAGIFELHGGTWDNSGCATGCNGLALQVSGDQAVLENVTLKGNGAGGALNNAAGTKVFDTGANTFAGGILGSGAFIGEANSSNLTIVTAAKLVLSANWGTGAAVSALSGGDAPIQFTITNGTTTGASPTVAYTFPIPYPVAPFSCTATQTGGTNATGTFTSSALSTTGVTFTFSLTPTASSTEIVQVTCVTP